MRSAKVMPACAWSWAALLACVSLATTAVLSRTFRTFFTTPVEPPSKISFAGFARPVPLRRRSWKTSLLFLLSCDGAAEIASWYCWYFAMFRSRKLRSGPNTWLKVSREMQRHVAGPKAYTLAFLGSPSKRAISPKYSPWLYFLTSTSPWSPRMQATASPLVKMYMLSSRSPCSKMASSGSNSSSWKTSARLATSAALNSENISHLRRKATYWLKRSSALRTTNILKDILSRHQTSDSSAATTVADLRALYIRPSSPKENPGPASKTFSRDSASGFFWKSSKRPDLTM
mmetsp:Transcript_56458/g.123413  ORF Transcript_56458/g.123413 Transcript_56458/m.123413 type:complete len:288 (-) Transcript_56458:292-1155(-)